MRDVGPRRDELAGLELERPLQMRLERDPRERVRLVHAQHRDRLDARDAAHERVQLAPAQRAPPLPSVAMSRVDPDGRFDVAPDERVEIAVQRPADPLLDVRHRHSRPDLDLDRHRHDTQDNRRDVDARPDQARFEQPPGDLRAQVLRGDEVARVDRLQGLGDLRQDLHDNRFAGRGRHAAGARDARRGAVREQLEVRPRHRAIARRELLGGAQAGGVERLDIDAAARRPGVGHARDPADRLAQHRQPAALDVAQAPAAMAIAGHDEPRALRRDGAVLPPAARGADRRSELDLGRHPAVRLFVRDRRFEAEHVVVRSAVGERVDALPTPKDGAARDRTPRDARPAGA